MKTASLSFVILIISYNLIIAQDYMMATDTVIIGDVNIVGRYVNGESGYKLTQITGENIIQSIGSSLSYLLERNSSLGVKNYGSGGLATGSFRGMGANQTKVLWEGIPINSPGTGQVDFSLIPVIYHQRVDIYHGASSIGNGTSGPGGTISLLTVPDWKKGTDIIFSQGFGSFGMITDDISLVTGSKSIQLITRAFLHRSDNDFPYIDDVNYIPPELKNRSHNNGKKQGLGQDIYFKTGNSILSANLWYSFSDRELPGPIISNNQTGESQVDEQFRIATGIKNYALPVKIEFKVALISDYIKYINNLADIESVTNSKSAYLFGLGLYELSKISSLKFSFSNRYNTVNSLNYNGFKAINHAILKSEFTFRKDDRFGIFIMAEANHANGSFYKPVVSVGTELMLLQGGNLFLKGNIGNSLTIPTLNDLFWSPGGNPDLINETGYNSEITFELREDRDQGFLTSGELTIYNSRLKNMIKWMPGEYGIWSPENLAEINSYGSEVNFTGRYKTPGKTLSIRISYSYSRVVNMDSDNSTESSIGKQLLYVPFHQANGELKYQNNRLSVSWFSDFTGMRYTTSDNSMSLPGYNINDFEFRYSTRKFKHNISTSFRLNNLFNTGFEYIAFYPMPGRNYRISLTYNLMKR